MGKSPDPSQGSSIKRRRVGPSGAALVGLGIGTLVSAGLSTYVLAELLTPDGVGVAEADPSGLARTVGLVVAGAVAVPGAVLAYRRQKALDRTNVLKEAEQSHKELSDHREYRASRDRNLRDRYTTCAEQLAHESTAVQLAGVYGLASLADDWHGIGNPDEQQVCVDLLCAVLRSPRKSDNAEVRKTILRILLSRRGRQESLWGSRGESTKWAEVHYDLTGADLSGASLTKADLTYARLDDADLTDAFLVAANLAGAELPNANLTAAELQSASFHHAFLDGANLTNTNFTEADLTNASLTGADLTDADLTNADLTHADLAEANLTRANLIGACLLGANLTDTVIDQTQWSSDTRWPDGYRDPVDEFVDRA